MEYIVLQDEDDGLFDDRLHTCVDSGRVCAVHRLRPRQSIVFRDIDEFSDIERATLVHDLHASSPIAIVADG